jgi:hypothetical protein
MSGLSLAMIRPIDGVKNDYTTNIDQGRKECAYDHDMGDLSARAGHDMNTNQCLRQVC